MMKEVIMTHRIADVLPAVHTPLMQEKYVLAKRWFATRTVTPIDWAALWDKKDIWDQWDLRSTSDDQCVPPSSTHHFALSTIQETTS